MTKRPAFFRILFLYPGYNNLEKMLAQESPDIVSICSPQPFHAKQLEMCYDYKIPMIWLEKPAATLAKEIEVLEKIRKKTLPHSRVLVNFHRRYADNYQNLKKLIGKKVFVQ